MHVYSYSSVAECGKHMGPWMAIVGHLDEVQPTDIIDPPYASGTMQATLCLLWAISKKLTDLSQPCRAFGGLFVNFLILDLG